MPDYRLKKVAIGIGPQTTDGPSSAFKSATKLGTAADAETIIGVDFIDGSFSLTQQNLYSTSPSRPPFGNRGADYTKSTMPSGFSFSMELKGGGNVLTGSDDSYELSPALSEVLGASGFRTTAGGSGQLYVPWLRNAGHDASDTTLNKAQRTAFKVWTLPSEVQNGSVTYVFSDCNVDISMNFTAGEIATIDVTVNSAEVASFTNVNTTASLFPTDIDFGTQSTLSAPILKSAGADLGILGYAGNVVGFISSTIEHSVGYDEGFDSNSSNSSSFAGGLQPYGLDSFRRYHNGVQNTTMTAEWYVETAGTWALQANRGLGRGGWSGIAVSFILGKASTLPGEVTNAIRVDIPNYMIESSASGSSGEYGTETLSGYAASVPNSYGFTLRAL